MGIKDVDWGVALGRRVPYGFTVLVSLWVLAFMYAMPFDDGYSFYDNAAMKMIGGYEATMHWAAYLVGMFGPSSLAACLAALLLTTHRLPESRVAWLTAVLSRIRSHPPPATNDAAQESTTGNNNARYGHELATHKVNQFGRGDPNFNLVALWLVGLPCLFGAIAYTPLSFVWADEAALEDPTMDARRLGIEYVSYSFGWMSVVALSFFLIPVARHSVLLAAMGWSPVNALRIHIWAGYTSFLFMILHGAILVPIWFTMYEYPVWQQVIPNPQCWTFQWTEETADDVQPNCYHVFANWTGIVAALFYIALWASSLHWVRRRNYRLFYICHVVFGTLTILGTILHMHWVSLVLLPSITYYLASTSPTLVQALASKFRGGVTVRAARKIPGSNGGVVEIEFEAHPTAVAELRREPCRFVKLCVPQLSFIWHPFDVYASPQSSSSLSTVRMLFRPAGQFTKALADRLFDKTKPPLTFLVDGFYRGADKCEQALQHDCVTMVAGGVAISPYLSLLPALLRRLASAPQDGRGGSNGGGGSNGDDKVKTIVLHWACREPGLAAYVAETYLSRILDGPARACRAARPDIDIKVNIYVTGAAKLDGQVVKTLDGPQGDAKRGDESATLASSSRFLAPTEGAKKDHEDGTGNPGSEDPSADSSSAGGDDGTITAAGSNKGHPMELARMLPRRHGRALDNLPYFAALSCSIWVGYWYFFKEDPHEDTSYYGMARMTWVTMYAVLMYVAYGIFVEASVFLLRKSWPQAPEPDPASAGATDGREVKKEYAGGNEGFAVGGGDSEGGDPESGEGGAGRGEGDLSAPRPAFVITYHSSRPTGAQLLEDARHASSPGVFLCGPASLTSAVKCEASKENSWLGLTRFCLYDEPYEM